MDSFLYPVPSNPDVNFRDALAASGANGAPPYHATAMNIVRGVPPIASRRYVIRQILVVAKENFGPELNFFSSAAPLGNDVAADSFLGRWGFSSSMGEQIGGSGLWRYFIAGLAIPYVDNDTIGTQDPPNLNMIMQNIDVTAKSAGDNGAVAVTVWLTPESNY